MSGATPHEAVSWGKVDPTKLPDAIVCYLDSTVALPMLTHYSLARHKPRKLKRLYDRLPELLAMGYEGVLETQQGAVADTDGESRRARPVRRMMTVARPVIPRLPTPGSSSSSWRVFSDKVDQPSAGCIMAKTAVLKDLARKHGTPLFIVDHDALRRNYAEFKKYLPRVQAYFAVKANPAPEIVRTFYEAGASFDVASIGEFRAGLRKHPQPAPETTAGLHLG